MNQRNTNAFHELLCEGFSKTQCLRKEWLLRSAPSHYDTVATHLPQVKWVPFRHQQYVKIKHSKSRNVPRFCQTFKESIRITKPIIQSISTMQGFASLIIVAMVGLLVNVSRPSPFQSSRFVDFQPRLRFWQDL